MQPRMLLDTLSEEPDSSPIFPIQKVKGPMSLPRIYRFTILAILFVLFCSLFTFAQNFSTATYDVGPDARKLIRGDFNHDGHEDLAIMNGNSTVTVLLNNGDGTFHRLDSASGAGTDMATADINKDGNPDLVMVNDLGNGTGTLSIMYGRGDGTFNAPVVIATRSGMQALALGDFNGDGNTDIAVGWNQIVAANGGTQYHANVSVLYGDGTGAFPTVHEIPNVGAQADYANGESGFEISYMNSGDFNGDGKTDFAIAECCGGNDVELGDTYTYTNNGDGTFTGHELGGAPPMELRVADVNKDGKTDLIMPYRGCHTPCYGVHIYTDSLALNSGEYEVPDAFSPLGEADGFSSGTAADFTGSGVNTVAYGEFGYYYGTTINTDQGLIAFATINGSGMSVVNTFNPGNVGINSLTFGDWNKDGKNDLAALTAPQDGSSTAYVSVYTNVGGPSIPICAQPSGRQVSICAPVLNSNVPGPLRVYATFNTNTLQSVQIYLDGLKVYQQATTFAFAVDTLIKATNGTHKITVKAWDASGSFSSTTYATVGATSSGGGGGTGGGSTCTATTNRSVKICSPTSGSSDASPVKVLAGLRSDSGVKSAQIYLDGTKIWQGTGTTVNQSFAMKSGAHKVTVKGWDTTGSFSSSVSFNVP